ncbi:MAG TPA: hypothetical protein VFI31_14195 [Pirellulales bacterium]|nr:hypothetical protein [Pirellulales bacterium]
MPNISWIDEEHATGTLAEVYRAYLAEHPEKSKSARRSKMFQPATGFLAVGDRIFVFTALC